MNAMTPMTASQRDGDLTTCQLAATMTSEHTLKSEAARAGVDVGEYQARLRQGLLWCYRCQDWHEAEAFPADARGTAAGPDHATRPSAPPPATRSQAEARAPRRRPSGSSGARDRPCGRCPPGSDGHTGAAPAAAHRAGTARGHGHQRWATTSPGSPAPARHATRSSPRPAGSARSRQAAAWYGWLNACSESLDHHGDGGRRRSPAREPPHGTRFMPHPEPGRPGSPPSRRNLTSMILPARRRSPPSANASHRSRIPGRPAQVARQQARCDPALADNGSRLTARPEGRRLWTPQTSHSGHQRVAAPNGITLSDEEDYRERACTRR